MRTNARTTTALAVLSVAALVAACGGHDHNDADIPATTAVPASASASIDGFIAYLKKLVVSSADTLVTV